MRLNKLNELIHNSSKYSNFNKASVEVHFQEIIDKVNKYEFINFYMIGLLSG